MLSQVEWVFVWLAEHIQTATQIITSCILLDGAEFMYQHAAAIVAMLSSLLGNVKERGMLLLLRIMNLMLCAFPEHAPSVMQPALQRLLYLMLAGHEESQAVAGQSLLCV
jgi:hypothetical protein